MIDKDKRIKVKQMLFDTNSPENRLAAAKEIEIATDISFRSDISRAASMANFRSFINTGAREYRDLHEIDQSLFQLEVEIEGVFDFVFKLMEDKHFKELLALVYKVYTDTAIYYIQTAIREAEKNERDLPLTDAKNVLQYLHDIRDNVVKTPR